MILCILLKYFTDSSVDTSTENFDSLSKKKLPVMEDKLSSLNIEEEKVGSPKKKLKYDDAGGY